MWASNPSERRAGMCHMMFSHDIVHTNPLFAPNPLFVARNHATKTRIMANPRFV